MLDATHSRGLRDFLAIICHLWHRNQPELATNKQGGRMTDPDGMRSSVRVLRPCGANRPIECIREEVFAGFRFDRHELAPVIRLQ